jgi:ABC-type xylose transport system permease subunit
MSRTLLCLALGLAVGVATHFSYFHFNEPAATNTLDGQLAWMKTELQLTDVQFDRIKELHQASSPRLRAMAVQVAALQAEFSEFEKVRRTRDQVDFLEFAHFVEVRRNLSRECIDSTRQLVLAAAEVMNPRQRQRYIQLVATAEPFGQSFLN